MAINIKKEKIIRIALIAVALVVVLAAAAIITITSMNKSAAKEIPANVTAKMTENGLLISWDGLSSNTYRIYRKTESDKDFHFLTDIKGNVFYDATAKAGMTYCYKVDLVKYNKLFAGSMSNAAIAGSSPVISTIFMNNDDTLTITWNNTGAISYSLYVIKNNTPEFILSSNETSAIVSGDYKDGAFAVTSHFMREDSETWETELLESASLLETPTVKKVSDLNERMSIVIINPVNGAKYYKIFRYSGEEAGYVEIGETYDTYFYDSVTKDDIPADIIHSYKIQAVSETRNSEISDEYISSPYDREIIYLPVIMYHDFAMESDIAAGILFDEYSIWDSEFESDLIFLRDNGYTTITSMQLVDYLTGEGELPDKPVLLTIDDGKFGVYKTAWPLLKKYNMTATLNVIGERIDEATADTSRRAEPTAPYCVWQELREMSESGAIEITSHTYYYHRYHTQTRYGADIGEDESESMFLREASGDYFLIEEALTSKVGKFVPTMAYPYSKRSYAADRVWLKAGYNILFAGDDSTASATKYNVIIKEAGLNNYSSVLRRLVRMTGEPLESILN